MSRAIRNLSHNMGIKLMTSLKPHRYHLLTAPNGSSIITHRLNNPRELVVVHRITDGNLLCKWPSSRGAGAASFNRKRYIVEEVKIWRIKQVVQV